MTALFGGRQALFASKGSPETQTPGRILPGALSYKKEYTTAVKFFALEISAAQHKKSESYFRSAHIDTGFFFAFIFFEPAYALGRTEKAS
jgi:hypothetical protein